MFSFTKTLAASFSIHAPRPLHQRSAPSLLHVRCDLKNGNDGTSSKQTNKGPTIRSPDEVEIRFRRGSRRRRRKQEQDGLNEGEQNAPSKDWDSMSLTEKAVDLYVGEKGLLFWLNKFAYASIFIVIGGWIAFRFVGPALNLYQLDTPPLAPTSMFKGP